MKVLEKNAWSYEFVCRGCKSRCLAFAEDVRVRNAAVYYAGETWEPVYYVACGACGDWHSLSEVRLPPHVQSAADIHPESAKR